MGSMLIAYIYVVVVLEHPKLMLTESKQMSESLRTFYKASSDFIGGALLSAEQQINANCIHTCCCGARAPKTNAYGKQVNDLVFHEIYKAQSDFIEDASLSVEQQVVLKTRSLWLPLLADNPWEHPKDEPPKFITHDTILTKESNTTIQSYNTAELWLISSTTIPSYNNTAELWLISEKF